MTVGAIGVIDLTGLDKAAVLAALYNRSRPLGLGFLHYTPDQMTVQQAREILATGQMRFDYLAGRVMKIDLSGDTLDPRLYDRDIGEGAAADALSQLKSQKEPA